MTNIILPSSDKPYVTIAATSEKVLTEVPAQRVQQLFMEHGALLLRGFPERLDDFRAFASQFCVSSVFNESPDRLLLDDAHNIQSVNGGSDAFPLHPELSREPWKPDVCFFYCLTPPREGGETTICDGIALARALPPELAAALAQRRLLYIQPAPPELLAFWLGTSDPSDTELAAPPRHCPYIFRRAGNHIVRIFTRPALHKPMFSDDLAFGNFLLFARYFLGRPGFPVLDNGQPVPDSWMEAIRQVSEALTVPIAWQQGDLLMLDNSRFMHGRRAILDTQERLIASYFGYLNFAPPNPDEPADPIWRRTTFRPPERAVARVS